MAQRAPRRRHGWLLRSSGLNSSQRWKVVRDSRERRQSAELHYLWNDLEHHSRWRASARSSPDSTEAPVGGLMQEPAMRFYGITEASTGMAPVLQPGDPQSHHDYGHEFDESMERRSSLRQLSPPIGSPPPEWHFTASSQWHHDSWLRRSGCNSTLGPAVTLAVGTDPVSRLIPATRTIRRRRLGHADRPTRCPRHCSS